MLGTLRERAVARVPSTGWESPDFVVNLLGVATRLLFFSVTCFALMPDRQNQHDVLGRQPAILRDVAVLATRQHEFAPTIFRQSTQQRVIRKNLEGCPYAREMRQCPPGIGFSDEIEQALQIAERPGAYFDARHERARGRRGFLPATLSAR